jgi:hypothetical protein
MHNNPYIQTPQWLVKFGFDLTCRPLPAGEPSSSNAATNQRPDNGDFLWHTIQIPKVFPNMQISGDPNLISQNLEVFSYDPKSNIYIYLRDCTSSIFKYQYHMPKLEVTRQNQMVKMIVAGCCGRSSPSFSRTGYKRLQTCGTAGWQKGRFSMGS